MGRAPLPIGTWGKVRTYVAKVDDAGLSEKRWILVLV